MQNGTGAPDGPGRPGPWSPPPEAGVAEARPSAREPILRAPSALLLLIAALLVAFALQSVLGVEAGAIRFGFAPADLERRDGLRLITAHFVHGGWGHVVMNALGALAFGAPVARLFGARLGGAVAFYGFYLVCGVIACLGYALVHPRSETLVVGASGAIAGLMGAASRLAGSRREGRGAGLAPLRDPTVVGMAAAWLAVNGLVAVLGVGVGTGTAPVAWEAHLFGYAAGLLLIWPAARALGRLGPGARALSIGD